MSHDPNEVTIGSQLKDSYKSYAAKPFKHRAAIAGTIGGIAGVIGSNQKDSSVISSIMDAGLGAGAAIGAESATSYIIRNHGDQIKEFLKQPSVNTGDVAKMTGEIDTERMIDDAAKNKLVGRHTKAFERLGTSARGVGMFIGATALLGVSHKLHRNSEVQRMQNEADLAMKKQQKEDKRAMSELFGYNKHQHLGQLAIDMWNDRMGHHKMGNAKFQ